MRHLLPKPVERLALRGAHRLRHYWRRLRKPHLHAVSVLVCDAQDRVLFIRHSYGPPGWTLPGGGVAAGEAPEAAARREMAEELGLQLSDLEWLETLSETVSGAPQSAHVFRASTDVEPRPDGREVVEARYFDPADVPTPLSALTRRRLEVLLRAAA